MERGYDGENSKAFVPSLSPQTLHFSEIFEVILESQIKDQQMRSAERSEGLIKGRMEALADKAFSLYVGVYGVPSSSNFSSIRSRLQDSMLGGSFENLSTSERLRVTIRCPLQGQLQLIVGLFPWKNKYLRTGIKVQ